MLLLPLVSCRGILLRHGTLHLYMRQAAKPLRCTYFSDICTSGNWQNRKSAGTFSASVHAGNGKIANPQVHSQHLCMREMAESRIRRYILGSYACGKWQNRKSAGTFSASVHAGNGKIANPQV